MVLLPLQQPWECHRGTPPHVWMVYCPNVDENDGLNWPLFAAAGVAHDSGGLGGDMLEHPHHCLCPRMCPVALSHGFGAPGTDF